MKNIRKKMLAFVFALASLALVVPEPVSAAMTMGFEYKKTYDTDVESGITTLTLQVSLKHISGDTYVLDPMDEMGINVTYKDGMTFESATKIGDFDVVKSGDKIILEYTEIELSMEAGDTEPLAELVFTYPYDLDGCSVHLEAAMADIDIDIFEDTNTQTGFNMPVVAVGVVGVLAVGAYVVTSRKNKIFNV